MKYQVTFILGKKGIREEKKFTDDLKKWRVLTMNKLIKLIMVITMLLGITFSIANFISLKVEAGTKDGVIYVWPDGTTDCIDFGSECKKSDAGAIS